MQLFFFTENVCFALEMFALTC